MSERNAIFVFIDLLKTGIMSGLPYLLMYGFSVVFSYLIDSLRRKEICSVSTLRKIGNLVCEFDHLCLRIFHRAPPAHPGLHYKIRKILEQKTIILIFLIII
jgi:hypothetical protein